MDINANFYIFYHLAIELRLKIWSIVLNDFRRVVAIECEKRHWPRQQVIHQVICLNHFRPCPPDCQPRVSI